jgi:biotin operon repressor
MQQKFIVGVLSALAVALPSMAATAADAEWEQRVGEALGKPGQEMPGGVYRVGLPRTDLHVKLDGVDIKPGLALGSWLAFKKMSEQDAMVMGDLVLTEAEVNPVMKSLENGGIEITALHNHLLRNQPFTMYMHVLGHGDPVKLAATLHQALSLSKTPLGGAAASGTSTPAAAAPQPELGFDPAIIDRALGHKGKASGGVYAVSVPRAEPVKEGGMEIPDAMGSAIAINFQGTGGGKVATTGDFVLIAQEVNPVVKALRDNGIEVTAVHNHMLDDQPRLFFMHFWANDDAEKVAKGLKAALDKVNVAKG